MSFRRLSFLFILVLCASLPAWSGNAYWFSFSRGLHSPFATPAPPSTPLSNGLSVDSSGNLLINASMSGGGTYLSNGLTIDSSGNLFVNCAVGCIGSVTAGPGLTGGGSGGALTLAVLFGGNPLAIQTQNALGTGFGAVNPVTTPASLTQFMCDTPTSLGVAQAWTSCMPGISGRAVTGTTDVIGNGTGSVTAPGPPTDCGPNRIEYAGSSSVAVGLPTPTALGVSSCTFKLSNQTTGSNTTVTVTPNTYTINGNATLVIYQNQQAWVYVDPNSATNWIADVNYTIPAGTEGQILCFAAAGSNPTPTGPGSARQLMQWDGASGCPLAQDEPDVQLIRLANCVAGTAAGQVATPSSGGFTPACRAGTNNLLGSLQGVPSTGATMQFILSLPGDWDTANQPYIAIEWGSGANTSGTVIWTAASACAGALGGATTDDPAFVAETAFTTKTMTTANRMWGISGQFANVTSGNNCVQDAPIIIKLSLSGTAASAINVYQVSVTLPRRPQIQAD